MKNHFKAFLIAILFHCILLFSLFILRVHNPQNPIYVKLNLNSEKPKKPLTQSKLKPSNKNVKNNKISPLSENVYMEKILNYETIKKTISASVSDSFHYKLPKQNKQTSNRIKTLNKYIKDKLKEDYPNQFSTKSKNPAPKEIPLQTDYIFDKIEAKAFSFLFKQNKGTQIDMYKEYDFSDTITASEFEARLDKLVKMGYLSRKKISPQLLFTISALFIQIPIEMSKQNRKNPVYEYQPLINKENLITYLQAKLFQLKKHLSEGKTDTLQIKKKISSLQESLLILTRQ